MNFHDAVRAEQELRRAIASRHPETIARAADENIWPLFSAHYATLRATIEALPSQILERHPILRVLHPLTPVLARTTRPYKPLISPDEARAMPPDHIDILTLVQIVAFRYSGDVAAALSYARRLAERILQIQVESRGRTDGPLWYYHYQIGSTLLAAGETSGALLELGMARQLGGLSLQPDAERVTLARTALAHAVRGSLDDADLALAEAEQHPAPTPAHRDSSLDTERTAAALVGVERMAEGIDELVSEMEPYDSIALTWPFALLARTRLLMARHRPDESLEAICLARDAHPAQHGSFATDVIESAYIESLWGVGDIASARRAAEANTKPGTLMLSAIVRLALKDSRLDVAAHDLRRLEQSRNLGPGHNSNLLLLSAWLEMARSDALDPGTARKVAQLALRRDTRRALASMPRQLIELVRGQLSGDEAAAFEHAISGLVHIDVQRRPVLTSSELRVLNALPVHSTTASIASKFHVSPNTIKSQLKSMYRKLGCSTRDEAIVVASRFRLFAADSG